MVNVTSGLWMHCLYCLCTLGSAVETDRGRCGTPTNAWAMILLNFALFDFDVISDTFA